MVRLFPFRKDGKSRPHPLQVHALGVSLTDGEGRGSRPKPEGSSNYFPNTNAPRGAFAVPALHPSGEDEGGKPAPETPRNDPRRGCFSLLLIP